MTSINDPAGPITLIFHRRVKAGREADFEAWVHAITEAALKFPGHRGADIIRPAGQRREYAIIFRFDSYEQARAWEESDVRAQWVERVGALTEGEAQIQRVSGLEFWFTPPAGATAAPPRWKMAVVTFFALWPLNVAANMLLAPWLGEWPLLLRAFISLALLVPLMTYAVMPWMTRLFSGWLYPRS
jgi:antibiotic biosynthesis monooxygenase (ABM) superfamily enzyme